MFPDRSPFTDYEYVLTPSSGTHRLDRGPGPVDGRVAVYGSDSDLTASKFSSHGQSARCSDWGAFEREMRDAACGIAVMPDLANHPHTSDLIEFKRTRPAQPIVLVTRPEFANLIHVRYLPVEEVVPMDCPAQSLTYAVEKAIRGTTYRRIERRLHNAIVPDPLPRALLHLWSATPCIVSVEKLALWLRCSRSTLYEAWNKAFRGHPPRSMKEVVGWIMLVRMIQHRDAGHSWKRVERTLGIGSSTLDRTAARLLNQSRAAVSSDSVAVLLRFETEVLCSILDTGERTGPQHRV